MRTVRILVMFFLCLFFLNIAWAIDIETGDFPLDSRDICDDHPYGKWAALSAASWSPGYWDLGESNRKIWAPNRAGVRVTYDNKVIIRFVLSDNDVKFLSLNFKDTDTRIPWGLEIDVVDHDNILGEKEVPDFSFTDNLPSEARIIYDTGALDDTNQLSVLIARPDELSPNKIYEIVFTPDQIYGNSGTLHFVFQLTLNYKYLAAMKNNNSYTCDLLDLMHNLKNNGSKGQGYSLVSGNYGDSLPPGAINAWYYFIAAESDISAKLSFNIGSTSSLCWDDKNNPEHNDSGYLYCGDLFNLNAGSNSDEDEPYNNSNPFPIAPDKEGNMGITGRGYSISAEAEEEPDPGLPDFILKKQTLYDINDYERYTYTAIEKIKMFAKSKNIGDADWAGDAEDIYVRWYLSKGYEARNGPNDWIRVGTQTIQQGHLDKGKTKTEWDVLDLRIYFESGYIEPENIYNVVACVDREHDTNNGDGEVPEEHKSNNCSSEAVFYVTEPPLEAQYNLTKITNLYQDQIIFIKNLGNIEGYRILDGITYNSTTGLALHSGLPYSGTFWRVHDLGNGQYAFECLGTAEGDPYLDGRTGDGTVGLAPEVGGVYSGAIWEIYQDTSGRYLFKCMGFIEGVHWLDGITYDHTVRLTNDLNLSGTRWDIIPFELTWSYAGQPANLYCERVYEDADPAPWGDNYLCANGNLDLAWSQVGELQNQRCTYMNEPAEPAEYYWGDNFLCTPYSSPIYFYWSTHNPIDNLNCIPITEPADPHTWDDNFLCYQAKPGPSYLYAGAITAEELIYDETTWTYEIINPKNIFNVGENIKLLVTLKNVSVTHRIKAKVYHNGNHWWTEESNWRNVGVGWDNSYLEITQLAEMRGTFTFEVYVDSGTGYEIKEVKHAQVTAPDYFYIGTTTSEDIVYHPKIWTYEPINIKDTFQIGEDIYLLARLEDVYVDHRWKVEIYYNDDLWWENEPGWNYVGSGWSTGSTWLIQNAELAGIFSFKVYLDTGDGYQLLETKHVLVE